MYSASASSLTLPGPRYVDDIYVNSDRTPRVLGALQSMFDHGRLAGTGFLSILPVDQGIEHSAGASFAPNPEMFDPEKIVELAVEDTGIGIDVADLPRLMKPFEQKHHGYSKRNGGTGLGLPLVDALVRLHGGTLTIDSAPGRGTRVMVRLPAPAVAAEAAA